MEVQVLLEIGSSISLPGKAVADWRNGWFPIFKKTVWDWAGTIQIIGIRPEFHPRAFGPYH
jgi:hypothetical protein